MKILPHHVYRRSELWRQILHECTICIRFSNIFSGGGGTPDPNLQEDKKLPSSALYDPLQLRLKLSHVAYIEDWSFEAKVTHNFLGKNKHELGKKMGSEYTFCIHFSKIFRGRPPDPHLYPLPTPPPPAALHADLVTPPSRQWTLWIRHCYLSEVLMPSIICLDLPVHCQIDAACPAHQINSSHCIAPPSVVVILVSRKLHWNDASTLYQWDAILLGNVKGSSDRLAFRVDY